MTTDFKDHFSGLATDYRAFRPAYPSALFEYLASTSPGRSLVWDCGTGNGQAAIALASHFERVFGTDASAEQIRNAQQHPRVEYAVAPAEQCPLRDRVADVVTVAQALHWFDFDEFYAEVRRVCNPGGLLAVWCYEDFSVNPAVDPVVHKLRSEVGPYWPPERALVDAGYRTIPFPFEEIATPTFEMTANWNLGQLLGYVKTWSSTKEFVKAKGFHPLEKLTPEFAETWGDPESVHLIRWPFNLRVGRVSV